MFLNALYPDRDLLNGGALTPAGRNGPGAALAVRPPCGSCLWGKQRLCGSQCLCGNGAALVPHSEPGANRSYDPRKRAASSAMMVAAIHLGECEVTR